MLALYILGGALTYIMAGSMVVGKCLDDDDTVLNTPDDKSFFVLLTCIWPLIAGGVLVTKAVESGKINWLGSAGKWVGRTTVRLWYGTGNLLFLPFSVGATLKPKETSQLPKAIAKDNS